MPAIIFLMCVLPSLSALELSTQDCTLNRLPSLYEQYCCVEDNRGKSFILSDNEDKIQCIMCPHETPASCSEVTFPSCSAILTSHPTATSGYYNIMLANGTVITVYCDMGEFVQLSNVGRCAEIKNIMPDSSSGYYNLQVEGENHTVYCNMEELCGDSGGWMRVGHLNMSDPSEQCPPGFRLYEKNGTRACGRIDRTAGCQSVKFPSHNINYTQVCGRVTGYQKGAPDGLYDRLNSYINQPYVDGVSITRGTQRDHIWTFIAGLNENVFAENGEHECPCAPNSPVTPQAFIGNDYFCESGNPGIFDKTTLYTDDPLWDGKQCGLIEEPCCNVTGIPWFNKVLEQPTPDYIELRVCGDDANMDDEDVPVGYYEIYVK